MGNIVHRAAIIALALGLGLFLDAPTWAQRGGGGRGGGGARGGGGGFRGGGGMGHSPSFSTPRPSMPASRPSMPAGRPGGNLGGQGIRPGQMPNLGGGNLANRPGGGNLNPGNRPGGGNLNPNNRPGGGNVVNRPGGNININNRPGGGNVVNRPGGNININNRPGGGNVVNRPGGNININNRPGGGNVVNVNRPGGGNYNFNRPYHPGWNNRPGWGGGGFGPGGGYWGGYRPGWAYHRGWVNGYWHGNWNAGNWGWGLGGFATGAALGGLLGWGWGSSLWNWGYTPYVNPYYIAVPVAVAGASPVASSVPYDYSQPIDTNSTPPEDSVAEPSVSAFDQARDAFKRQDFGAALTLTDQALKEMPSDATAHEFRALCLFALGRYDQASAPLYAVLSVGPGWDWTTMIGLYDSVETYTGQLRALEKYVGEHPDSAPERFVLAYHYLTQGASEAAVGQYREVVRLQPSDKLSASLIQALSQQDQAQAQQPDQSAQATPPPAEAKPAASSSVPPPAESALIGTWKASPQPDVSITLALQPEHKFSWSVIQKGKSQSFGGEFTYGGETMTLVQQNGPALVGRTTWTDNDHFRFQVVGGPPDDPGLAFSR